MISKYFQKISNLFGGKKEKPYSMVLSHGLQMGLAVTPSMKSDLLELKRFKLGLNLLSLNFHPGFALKNEIAKKINIQTNLAFNTQGELTKDLSLGYRSNWNIFSKKFSLEYISLGISPLRLWHFSSGGKESEYKGGFGFTQGSRLNQAIMGVKSAGREAHVASLENFLNKKNTDAMSWDEVKADFKRKVQNDDSSLPKEVKEEDFKFTHDDVFSLKRFKKDVCPEFVVISDYLAGWTSKLLRISILLDFAAEISQAIHMKIRVALFAYSGLNIEPKIVSVKKTLLA